MGRPDLPTGPRAHADANVLARHRAAMAEPDVAPLNALADRIGEATGYHVPRFDPTMGGVDATVVALLESPGPASTTERGSGIISPHNNDPSAEHMWTLFRDTPMQVNEAVVWNVVPWWMPADPGSAGTFRTPNRTDLTAGVPWTLELLGLLPDCRVVMTLGRPAQLAWRVAVERDQAPPVNWVAGPHPGARNWNNPRLREACYRTFAAARRLLDDPPASHAFVDC